MTIHFILSGRKQDDLYCNVFTSSIRVRLSLGIKVPAGCWNAEQQRAVVSGKWLAARSVNVILDKIRANIESQYYEMVAQGKVPGKDDIAAMVKPNNGRSNLVREFAREYITKLQTKTNMATGRTLARATWMKHKQCLDVFVGFRENATFDNCDRAFYTSFTQYLVEQKYALNTIGKYLSLLRTWIREAEAAGIAVHPFHRSADWYVGREKTMHVSLTLDELRAIERTVCTSPLEQSCKDLFLISAYTGLRYSDVTRLSEAQFRDGVIIMEQSKTGTEVVVPELPEITGILEKYRRTGRAAPPQVSNVIMNRYIKVVAERAGIVEDVVLRRSVGGNRQSKTYKKCDLITTHTARRSFAKNLFVSGFNLSWLSRLMGHSNVEQTIDYIGIDGMEKAMLLKQHWSAL